MHSDSQASERVPTDRVMEREEDASVTPLLPPSGPSAGSDQYTLFTACEPTRGDFLGLTFDLTPVNARSRMTSAGGWATKGHGTQPEAQMGGDGGSGESFVATRRPLNNSQCVDGLIAAPGSGAGRGARDAQPGARRAVPVKLGV